MSGAFFLGWRYLAHHRFKSGILIASITLMLFLPAATKLLVEDSASCILATDLTRIIKPCPGGACVIPAKRLEWQC